MYVHVKPSPADQGTKTEKETSSSGTVDQMTKPKRVIQTKAELRLQIRELQHELKASLAGQDPFIPFEQGRYTVPTDHPAATERVSLYVNSHHITVENKKIPHIWLRDNCQCGHCVHAATKQRLLDTFSIPRDIYMKDAKRSNNTVSVQWSDGHKSIYKTSFLTRLALDTRTRSVPRLALSPLTLWNKATISSSIPSVPYDTTTSSILPVLENIRKYGFCYVDDTPHSSPAATEALLRRIAFIRETHYGGFYDFTADLASKDTAYTNIALEAHTDTTYFSDPAGLQAFHLLEHTGGRGGTSLLVDGFHVAQTLLYQSPLAYNILARVHVHAHASGNEDTSIQPYRGFPVLEHDPLTGILIRVRWNNADRAGIGMPTEHSKRWYDAAREFDALVKQKENEYWEQLQPGRVLIFDNWRVLHGRSAFQGKRRICGGYVNRDDWISKYKMLKYGREKVLENLATA